MTGERLVCAGLTSAVSVLLLAFGPAPGDAAVHLYRTLLVQHGALLWDNFWYAGQYPLAVYSLVYYLPARSSGTRRSCSGRRCARRSSSPRSRGRSGANAALWPSPDLRGLRGGAALHRALQLLVRVHADARGGASAAGRRRPGSRIVLAALTLGCSALAFLFLCLLLGSVAVAAPAPVGARRRSGLGVALVVIAAFELFVLRLFPSRGRLPVPSRQPRCRPRRSRARDPACAARPQRSADPRVLRPLGRREHRRLDRRLADRGQLDTPRTSSSSR